MLNTQREGGTCRETCNYPVNNLITVEADPPKEPTGSSRCLTQEPGLETNEARGDLTSAKAPLPRGDCSTGAEAWGTRSIGSSGGGARERPREAGPHRLLRHLAQAEKCRGERLVWLAQKIRRPSEAKPEDMFRWSSLAVGSQTDFMLGNPKVTLR